MKVAVIGGGPAGCAAAYALCKRGHKVVLFEAQDHVGGRTSQVRKEGFNLGSGALFLMGGIYPRTRNCQNLWIGGFRRPPIRRSDHRGASGPA
jgi:phytoene dehydrogenase-like protein